MHGSVYGPVPVGAEMTAMASWELFPQSISTVYGYTPAQVPGSPVTEGFPVAASVDARVVGRPVDTALLATGLFRLGDGHARH
jgi:hypothetical protein